MKKILLSVLFVLLIACVALAYFGHYPFNSHDQNLAGTITVSGAQQVHQPIAQPVHTPNVAYNFGSTAPKSTFATSSPQRINPPRRNTNFNSQNTFGNTVVTTSSFPSAPPVVNGVVHRFANNTFSPPSIQPTPRPVVQTSFRAKPALPVVQPKPSKPAKLQNTQQGTFSTSSNGFRPSPGPTFPGKNAFTGPVLPRDTGMQNSRTTNFPVGSLNTARQTNRVVSRASTQPFSKQLPTIATNVQTLVRAQYKLPIEAAKKLEELFGFEGNEKVETKTLDIEHPKLILLQVTTDSTTQKAVAQFLNTIYSAKRIEEIESDSAPEDIENATEDSEKVSLQCPE